MVGFLGYKYWFDSICFEKSVWIYGILCNIEESCLNVSILEFDGIVCNVDCGIYNNYVF